MTLVVPLSQEQIDAAGRLYMRLEQWRLSDAAITRLREVMPGYSAESCLLKAVTINTLYGTQVFAIVRMGRHIEAVMANTDPEAASIKLVDKIASLPFEAGERPRRFVSFASKFCHFFVNSNRFPIYDSAARKALELHLGSEYRSDAKRPYEVFCQNLRELEEQSGVDRTGRTLDRYLWLVGMFMMWQANNHSASERVNAELGRMLDTTDESIIANLSLMLPPSVGRLPRNGP